MAMPLNIEKQCRRLGLDSHWKTTIERYIEQFESVKSPVVAMNEAGDDDTLAEYGNDQPDTTALIHDALQQISPETDDRTMRRVFSEAVARFPVFYHRLKVSVDSKEQFWYPLNESVAVFLSRTGSNEETVRRYTADSPIYAEDVIASRVFSDLAKEIDGY